MAFFSGKTVYITGGSSGMGLLAAQKLAAQGAHIAVFDRSSADAAMEQIKAARNADAQRVSHYQLNVAERDGVLATVAQAAAEFGPPDILINMAGIGGVAEFIDMKYEMFDRMMQVNVYGSRNIVEAVLPFLQKNVAQGKRAQIVLVGSMGGIIPVFGYTAYGTSKFAVVGFAQCLRYELKPRGIEVACFCPGEVDTPGLAAERAATHPAAVALKKIGGTISVEQAVQGLLDGIERGEFMISPGIKTKLTFWAQRLTPLPLWNYITDGMIVRALKGTKSGA